LFEVINSRNKIIKFDGKLIASSSSRRKDSNRWVEFDLYQTSGGAYILSRIGKSNIFHDPSCAVVERNRIKLGTISSTSVPCEECKPTADLETPYVEEYRYWAQVSETPEAVIDSLYRRDDLGICYLTGVAARLLEAAGKVNTQFSKNYKDSVQTEST
jgi:hypothetical protein